MKGSTGYIRDVSRPVPCAGRSSYSPANALCSALICQRWMAMRSLAWALPGHSVPWDHTRLRGTGFWGAWGGPGDPAAHTRSYLRWALRALRFGSNPSSRSLQSQWWDVIQWGETGLGSGVGRQHRIPEIQERKAIQINEHWLWRLTILLTLSEQASSSSSLGWSMLNETSSSSSSSPEKAREVNEGQRLGACRQSFCEPWRSDCHGMVGVGWVCYLITCLWRTI